MQPEANSTITNSIADDVVQRLRKLKVISNHLLAVVVAALPGAIVILLLADWLIGSGAFASDFFRLSGVLSIALELFILNHLFRQLPEAFSVIWKRDLLTSPSDREQPGEEFIKFIDAFEKTINSRWAIIFGIVGAVAGIGATYPVRYFLQIGRFPFTSGGLFAYYLWGNAAIVAAPLGYVLGILIWRVGVIAIYISKLGHRFEVRIQPNHPDHCGGLRPVGNLCLIIALLLLVPAIFLSVWGFATTFFNASGEIYNQLWSGLFRQWLLILSVLAFVAFLWPLYNIHVQMQKERRRVQVELDDLAQKIDVLSTELRTKAYSLTPSQGDEKLKSLEFMDRVYQQNSHIPIWPIDWRTIFKFSSAQVLPVLSLLGTSEPISKLIESILASTGN